MFIEMTYRKSSIENCGVIQIRVIESSKSQHLPPKTKEKYKRKSKTKKITSLYNNQLEESSVGRDFQKSMLKLSQKFKENRPWSSATINLMEFRFYCTFEKLYNLTKLWEIIKIKQKLNF